MTREEAIEMFKSMIKGKSQLNACGIDSTYDFRCGESFFKALDVAIKTLEQEPILDKIRAEIIEEKDFAYADFDRYKEEVLCVEADELPDDDYRYGMERCIEIIDKYKAESEEV